MWEERGCVSVLAQAKKDEIKRRDGFAKEFTQI
jgi:hypothetical protein